MLKEKMPFQTLKLLQGKYVIITCSTLRHLYTQLLRRTVCTLLDTFRAKRAVIIFVFYLGRREVRWSGQGGDNTSDLSDRGISVSDISLLTTLT